MRISLVLALTVASICWAEESYPRVLRKGTQTCVQTLDTKGNMVEACRGTGQEYVPSPGPGPATPPAPTTLPSEYPKVIRREDQTCIQTLDAIGQVVEECRAGSKDFTGNTQVIKQRVGPEEVPTSSPKVARANRSAKLSNSDPHAGFRMFAEGGLALLVAPIPLGILSAVCSRATCSDVAVVVTVLSLPLLMGFAASLGHWLVDGEAGAGWGVIGAAVGVALAVALLFAAGALGTSYFGVLLYAVAGIAPIAGTIIALELRDTSLRYDPAPSAALGRIPRTAVALTF